MPKTYKHVGWAVGRRYSYSDVFWPDWRTIKWGKNEAITCFRQIFGEAKNNYGKLRRQGKIKPVKLYVEVEDE